MATHSHGLILVWHVASIEALAARHATIKPGHFFLALCKVCDLPLEEVFGDAAGRYRNELRETEREVREVQGVFARVGIDVVRCRRRLRAELGTENAVPADGTMHRSEDARALFRRAEEIAEAMGEALRPMHLLMVLCEAEDTPWARVVAEFGVSMETLRRVAEEFAQGPLTAEPREATEPREVPGPGSSGVGEVRTAAAHRAARGSGLIEQIGRDLTHLARENRLPPTIGRRCEILRLAQILLQHERNNAIVVGEAGVGKTRVVEGLAAFLASGQAPEELASKRIIEVSMSALLAGTQYRGQFEERIRQLITEASDPNIILFLDEIHTMMGAGQAEGQALDAADMLKPALSRGEIRVIGATTPQEFSRYIEPDAALTRRFDIVWVDEPSRDEAVEMLQGLVPGLQAHHGLPILGEAVEAAVDLSIRYIHDRCLPDKAARLLDAACSRARLESFSVPTPPPAVTRRHVADTLAELYGVAVEEVLEDEAARLLRMDQALRERVKGQDEAIEQVCSIIRAARTGMKPPNRPWAVLFFVGPTGVGKTELAKALAEFLFGSEEQLIRFDMSEFTEPHSVARLVGAPPGYVGHEEGGTLVEAVRRRPHCVVLFDELEKAHPNVHRLFLQIFDDGRLTDARGRQARFDNAVVILTSNLGFSAPIHRRRLGFHDDAPPPAPDPQALRARFLEALRQAIPPELLNRIDRIVFFHGLSPDSIRQIIDKLLQPLIRRLALENVSLRLDESAYELLMEEGYSEEFGARAMERAISRLIAEPLGEMLLAATVPNGATIHASRQNAQLLFQVHPPAP